MLIVNYLLSIKFLGTLYVTKFYDTIEILLKNGKKVVEKVYKISYKQMKWWIKMCGGSPLWK